MYLDDATKLMEKYATCPNCGSNKISDGKMNYDGYVFKRSCKCGFSIEINSNEVNIDITK